MRPPEPLDGDVHGSLGGDAVAVLLGVAEVLVDAEAVGVAGVVEAASARSAWLPDIPRKMLKPPEEADGAGDAAAEEAAGEEVDDDGARAFVRLQTSACNDGKPPELGALELDVGAGEAVAAGPELDAAAATVAGVSTTTAAASPIVTRFICGPPDGYPPLAVPRTRLPAVI